MAETVEDFLEHFGVKGMRWGVRDFARSWDRGASRNVRRNSNAAREARFKKTYGHKPTSLKDKIIRDFDIAGTKKENRHKRNKDDRNFIIGSVGAGVIIAGGIIAVQEIMNRNRYRRLSDLDFSTMFDKEAMMKQMRKSMRNINFRPPNNPFGKDK